MRVRTLLLLSVSLLRLVPSAGADGMLDPSFGNGGIVLTDFNPNQPISFARAVVVMPDGRAVAVGNTTPNLGGTYMAAARYLTSGALDPSFGNGGLTYLVGGPFLASAYAEDVVLEPSGAVILVGGWQLTQTPSFSLVRVGGGGPWGTNGYVHTAFPGGASAAAGVLQPDGRIIAVGSSGPQQSPTTIVAARYNTDGTLDPTFGASGTLILPLPQVFRARDVALQPDGKLLIAGTYGASDFGLVRLLPGGTPDPSFDGDGLVTSNFGGTESGHSVFVLGDGRLVLGGLHNGDFALVRYLPNGAVDTTFGAAGLATAPSAVAEEADEAIVLPNGNLMVAGFTIESANRDFVLARFTAGGALDTSFGSSGFLRTDIGAFDECHAVALAGPDLILTAGSRSPQPGPGFGAVFALARYIAATPVELLSFAVD